MEFRSGQAATIKDLKSERGRSMNGRRVKLLQFNKERGQWDVLLDGATISVKAENLRPYSCFTDDLLAANAGDKQVRKVFLRTGSYFSGDKAIETSANSLNFPSSKIKEWPANLSLLVNLTSISLCNNLFSHIPSEIGALKNLNSLDLSNNRIESIPDTIHLLENLSQLFLANNAIEFLPEEIGSLSLLAELHLQGNRIHSLPSSMGILCSLRHLDLSENNLQQIPAKICNLPRLAFLNLSNNRLLSLPTKINRLQKLLTLNAENNHIRELPYQMSEMLQLTQLKLAENQIEILPEWVGRLTCLTELDFSKNLLEELPNSLNLLINLKKLCLEGNNIPVFPDIGGLAKLEYIKVGSLPSQQHKASISGKILSHVPSPKSVIMAPVNYVYSGSDKGTPSGVLFRRSLPNVECCENLIKINRMTDLSQSSKRLDEFTAQFSIFLNVNPFESHPDSESFVEQRLDQSREDSPDIPEEELNLSSLSTFLEISDMSVTFAKKLYDAGIESLSMFSSVEDVESLKHELRNRNNFTNVEVMKLRSCVHKRLEKYEGGSSRMVRDLQIECEKKDREIKMLQKQVELERQNSRTNMEEQTQQLRHLREECQRLREKVSMLESSSTPESPVQQGQVNINFVHNQNMKKNMMVAVGDDDFDSSDEPIL